MGEREELVGSLDQRRKLLLRTVRDLTDEQAARHTTVSELTLGGLIKHCAFVEARWARFVTGGAEAMRGGEEDWAGQFRMAEGETLAGLLDGYRRVADETDGMLRDLPDFDLSHPLPPAPWFEPGARWSARQVVLHLIAETAQHAGHADIIRESLDGAKSMA